MGANFLNPLACLSSPGVGTAFSMENWKLHVGNSKVLHFPTVSSSRHGLDACSTPPCHGQSLPGCFFHSEAYQRAASSKLSMQLPQSWSCLTPFWPRRAQTIRPARVSNLSWVFLGAHTCIHPNDSRDGARLVAHILLASQCPQGTICIVLITLPC